MYAIGHFALGYLAAKGTSKPLKTKVSLPLLFAVTVLPDIDLAIGFFTGMHHRLITHSLITYTVVLIPFLLVYRKQVFPYYAALLTHSLIGDFFTGGLGLFWSITGNWYGLYNVNPSDIAPVVAELVLFALTSVIMIRTKDLQSFFKPSGNSLWLIISFIAVLGPIVQMAGGPNGNFEGSLPILLVAPSMFWLAVFGWSIVVDLRYQHRKPPTTTSDDMKSPTSV